MHHREKCAAQGTGKKVVEEECIARALAHNISEQTKKLLFLWNNLHLSTHGLSNGRHTLWQWLCGMVPWLGLRSWLLEWSSGPGCLGPQFRCRFLRCLALGDLRFLLLFCIALLLLISIALVGIFTGECIKQTRLLLGVAKYKESANQRLSSISRHASIKTRLLLGVAQHKESMA